MRPRPFVLLFALLAALPLSAPRAGRADEAAARKALLEGDWGKAEAEFRALAGASPAAGALGLAELYRITGRHAEALEQAEAAKNAAAGPAKAAALVLTGEVQRELGRGTDAVASALAALQADPKHLRARLLLGQARWETGQRVAAEQTFTAIVRELAAGKLDRNQAETLFVGGVASRYLRAWQEANGLFQDAVEKDPNLLEANLEWGDLFLEKYNVQEAAKCFTDVLKVNRNHPLALVGMAAVREEAGDSRTALRLAEQALANNPRLVSAFTLQAAIALGDEDFTAADEPLARALAVNPNHVEALGLLGAGRWLREDLAGYREARDRALRADPAAGGFFRIVGEFAVRHHRYPEAVEILREGAKVDPQDGGVLAALGLNLLRLGLAKEPEGLRYVKQAFDADPFNVRTFNTLNLYEDVIAKEYEAIPSGTFTYRLNKKERPLLIRYVDPVMKEAWKLYVERYGFTPTHPITVELFTRRDHYGARTIGLPELGAQGTCFGELITAMSPSAAEANWDLVLRHELAHVFHLQLSLGRVARWFTEGLSEYETNIVHPWWKRENAREIYLSMRRGELWKIQELSAAFTRPSRPNGVMIAYQQSSLVIAYLAETYGFPRLVEALKLYGQGKHDPEIFPALTGKSLDVLNAEFAAWLKARYPHYARGFLFDPQEYRDMDRLQKEAQEKPGDAGALARLAAAVLVRSPKDALAPAEAALKVDPQNELARYVRATAHLSNGDADSARADFEGLLTEGNDGYELRATLGRLAAAEDRVEEAARHLAEAKKLDPDESEPYEILMELYERKEMRDELLKEAEALLDVEEHNHNAARLLIDRYALDRRWSDLIRIYPRVIGITPMEAFVHHQYGVALVSGGKWKEALFPLESALIGGVRRPGPLKGLLARCYLEAGNRARAKALAQEALKEAPGNVDAQEVLRRVP